MAVQFKHFYPDGPNECELHFCTKVFIASQEFSITVETKDGKAVKIKYGTVINSGGWYDWDEVGVEEKDLLELVNRIYEDELKGMEVPA